MSNDSEYEKLKTFCDQNGLDVINESGEFNNFFLVVNKKKDIWEGVEFCKSNWGDSIYPVSDLKEIDIKQGYTPSTEEAYVNQLKAKAFELYGEIKEGDRFKNANLSGTWLFDIKGTKAWTYSKKYDQLFCHNIEIYAKGQWAKKLPKRIEVQTGAMIRIPQIQHTYGMSFTFNSDVKLSYEHHAFLNKQLEKYLNEEIETP
jgi:hypothetical protein